MNESSQLTSIAHSGQGARHFADVALVQAAINTYDAGMAEAQKHFFASALGGRPHVVSEVGRTTELRYQRQRYSLKTYCLGPRMYRLEMGGVQLDAQIERLDRFECRLAVFGRTFRTLTAVQGQSYRIEVNGVAHQIQRDDGGIVRAPAPAVVVSIAVKPGDQVTAGDRLAVLEAMKMEAQLLAPFSGRVRRVLAIRNVQVEAGAPLLQIDPIDAEDTAGGVERVLFGVSSASATEPRGKSIPRSDHQGLDEIRQLMLGFDIDGRRVSQILTGWSEHGVADDDAIRKREDDILRIFVDGCCLFQRDPEVNHRASGEEPSAEVHLFSYLRMVETGGRGLPPAFVKSLLRALAHYGVHTLEFSPQLEASLLRIYKAHQRVEEQLAPVVAVLERRLQGPKATPHAAESMRMLLDRMASLTNGLLPAVTELAREVRYRYFDQASFERARQQVYAQIDEHLRYLAANPHAADRIERLRSLVECPQPLVSLLSARFASSDETTRNLMLEALTLRYYRIRELKNFHSMTLNDRQCCASAEYDLEGRKLHVMTTHCDYSRLHEAARTLFPLISEVPADVDVLLDFYVFHSGRLDEQETTQQEVRSIFNQVGFPRPIRRILATIAGPAQGQSVSPAQHFTYRPNGEMYEEEKLFRGIHPMMGKRLHLWRLNNFKIERLPSVEDVYLLHAVARDNPKDERLFACAEVRDVTPVRNEQGRIVQLPHLERMLSEAMAGIRLFQSRRPAHQRLYWNRILLNVWPPLTLGRDELRHIVRRLAPSAEGLGLEQVVVRARIPNRFTGELRDTVVRISSPGGSDFLITFRPADQLQPIRTLTEYEQKVVRMRQRGLIYPYEIIKMLTPAPQHTRAEFPSGDFVEHDLDGEGRLIPVDRPYGQNKANIIVGIIRNFTTKYPEGMTARSCNGRPE